MTDTEIEAVAKALGKGMPDHERPVFYSAALHDRQADEIARAAIAALDAHRASQAHVVTTVKPDREQIADVLQAHFGDFRGNYWTLADKLLALWPGKTEREVAEAAWDEGLVVGRALAYIGRYDQYDTGSLMFRETPDNPHCIEKGAEAVIATLAEHDRKVKADALREHRRRVTRFMPPGLVNRATVLADLEDYASRYEKGVTND